jgi:fructose-1,6-bisphosphatase
MIQGVVTTQPTVGVGWGNYVIAWLLTYSGSDCGLWQLVYRKCMESELCRRVLELLPTIGYSLEKHKCYADLDAEIIETQVPTSPKHQNQNSSTTQATSQTNHSKTKLHNRLDAYALPSLKNHPSLLPLLHTPHLIVGASPGQRAHRAGGSHQ